MAKCYSCSATQSFFLSTTKPCGTCDTWKSPFRPPPQTDLGRQDAETSLAASMVKKAGQRAIRKGMSGPPLQVVPCSGPIVSSMLGGGKSFGHLKRYSVCVLLTPEAATNLHLPASITQLNLTSKSLGCVLPIAQ